MEDVKVLDLGVQTAWSSEQVAERIKSKTEKYGLEIVYGISDNCSKLKRAMKLCNMRWIADCTHEIAKVSKRLFKQDEESNKFITKMNLLRRKWILSKHVLLVPPELRTKDRFNQMFIIHKWAEQILKEWQSISAEAKKELQFVQQNKELIKSMRQCYELIDLFSAIFKSKGIQNNSMQQWDRAVQKYKSQEALYGKAKEFIEKMNEYLERQRLIIPEEMQILCCSDIIESTFGKYKNKRGAKIMTEDVLKIAAYPELKDTEQVKLAMESIKIVQIQDWKKQNTTVSKLARLKKFKSKSAA